MFVSEVLGGFEHFIICLCTVVETEEQPHVPAAGKKECGKRAAAAKKKSSTVVLDSSDSDNENVVADDDDDDDDFELHKQAAPETEKKKRGRELAAENAGIWPEKKVKISLAE